MFYWAIKHAPLLRVPFALAGIFLFRVTTGYWVYPLRKLFVQSYHNCSLTDPKV